MIESYIGQNGYRLEFDQMNSQLWTGDEDTSPCINIISIFHENNPIINIRLSLDTSSIIYTSLLNTYIFERTFSIDLPAFSTTDSVTIISIARNDYIMISFYIKNINAPGRTIDFNIPVEEFEDAFLFKFFFAFLIQYEGNTNRYDGYFT